MDRFAGWKDDGRPFDWGRVFARRAPRVLDIGCGDGRYLIASALSRPECDHLGIELVGPLVAKGIRDADRRGLSNVRFVTGDAVMWLFKRLGDASIDEIHVYHPQPYHDPAQAGMGMLTAEFFERAWQVILPRGLLVLQTDHRAYGKHLLEACRKHFDPEIRPGPWPEAPFGRTRRETVALRKRLAVLRVTARRRESPLDVASPPDYFEPGRAGVRTVRAARKRKVR
jgi:tRNA (guanine-N7-)-methyltransferase